MDDRDKALGVRIFLLLHIIRYNYVIAYNPVSYNIRFDNE